MQVTLSTTTFDIDGHVVLDCLPGTTDLGEVRRRMNRVQTLDGGAAFNDAGYSEADRTIRATWLFQGAEKESAIARMVRLYQRLILSCDEGVFLVAPESYKATAEGGSLSLLVAEKLTT
jgi:hypothetical protein